jgi:hypothetical protein
MEIHRGYRNRVQPAKGHLMKNERALLRKCVYWQGALKENGVKQVGCRTGATWTCVYRLFASLLCFN